MDGWEDEENGWFGKYLPGQDLPDDLEWTPFNVDLTTGPDMTTRMYPGLRRGLQDTLMTTGCKDLEALITHRAFQVDDDSFDSGRDEPVLEFSPELGIYPTSCSHPDILRSATTQVPTHLCLARYSEVDVLVEVRRSPTSSVETDSGSATSLSDDISHFELNLDGDDGPLEESVNGVFTCQHRLFVFMILFIEDKARLLHFDRARVSMTPEFDYTHRPEVIGKFLYRLSGSRGRTAKGHDPTATRANDANAELFRNLHTRYHAASAVGRGLRDAAREGWPIYKLCIEARFSPDGSTAVRRNSPESRREYLVGRPTGTWGSVVGRGTKIHIAYDLARDQVVVIKDSWRADSESVRSEYDTYLRLYAAGTEHQPAVSLPVPTLLGGGDVMWDGVTQESQTLPQPQPVTRVHCRLVFKEVCRHLEDFTGSLELVRATLYALGAHSGAWAIANILHRDVSVNSILILDKNPEDPPDPKTSKGLLADWDLARTKEELGNPAVTPNTRSGTWPFISARLQQSDLEQPHELSDDLESFFHVLNYCALKHLPNTLSHDHDDLVSFISRVYNHVPSQSGKLLSGSSTEKLDLLTQNRPFVRLQPQHQPLQYLLDSLSELCHQHYYHIQFPPPSPYHPQEGISFEALEGDLEELGVVLSSNPAARPWPPIVFRPWATPALPPPDPSESPFNDHWAIGEQFRHVLRSPPSHHPAYGLPWPVDDKITRTTPGC